eukprot:83403_1
MTIQIYSMVSVSNNVIIDPITLMALTMSALSLTVGILTLISRACGNRVMEGEEDIIVEYKFDIKSKSIKSKHQFIHNIFSKLLSKILETHPNRVETIQILQTAKGIVVNVNIKLQNKNERNRIDNIIENISTHSKDQLYDDTFKLMLCQKLNIKSANSNDLNVTITKIDRNIIHAAIPTTSITMSTQIDANKEIVEMEGSLNFQK